MLLLELKKKEIEANLIQMILRKFVLRPLNGLDSTPREGTQFVENGALELSFPKPMHRR